MAKEPKNEEVLLTKICISIGDIDITVSPKEAEKLYNVLHKMYGEKVVYRDNNWYSRPYYPNWYGGAIGGGLTVGNPSLSDIQTKALDYKGAINSIYKVSNNTLSLKV